MNTQDETAGNSVSSTSWCGFDMIRLVDDNHAVDATIGSLDRWNRSHLRRLRQSADLPGLVPVIDADFSSDGKPFAVTPVLGAQTLADRLPPSASDWEGTAAITEAAARAAHEAHLRGLFHGSLSPDQIHLVDDDVAVNGIGLGLGGSPKQEYVHWVAPEVLDGNDATERSDVFSLGKILEASLGDSIDDAPRSVRRLIMWSSSNTPEARPPSALEFASILAEALGDDRPTCSPAFIATAETNDLASTASESVAAHVSSGSSGGAGRGIAAAGAATGAAAIASSRLSSDDGPAEGDDGSGETVGEMADVVDEPLGETIDTGESPAGVVNDTTVTQEVTEADVQEVAETDVEAATSDSGVFASEGMSSGVAEKAADDEYVLPAAAQTLDIEEDLAQEENRSNRAGILVGAILAAGLAVVAWGLFTSGGDDGSETDTTGEVASPAAEAEDESGATTDDEEEGAAEPEEEAATPTTAAEADDEAASTSETGDGDEGDSTATADTDTEEEAPAEDEAPADEEAVAPAATVDGPIAAEDAGVQVLHGIPGTEVDIYVNGEALAPGFTVGTVAGPADLAPGAYDIAIYEASDSPPVDSSDRDDDPIISDTVNVGVDPATLVAHLGADGEPTLSAYVEDLNELEPAQGRLEVRHLAAAPAVKAVVDGEEIDGLLEPGAAATLSLSADEHTIEAVTEDGDSVISAPITLGDGELVSISVFGSAENDTINVAVQRFTGLAAAPVEVPAGDSNLLGSGDDMTGLYLMGLLSVLLAGSGGVIMLRRSRQML